MTEPSSSRKLAAILSADIVGYSRLMQADDEATVATLKEYRAAVGRIIARHHGRVVNAPGDSILAEFRSAQDAVSAAVDVQQSVEGRNRELADERRMHFRIGVNLGDVIEEDDGTLYGDGVNIAARMEALAEGGGICVSSTVYDAIVGKLALGFDFLGEQQVKNIAQPVRVYRVRTEPRVEAAAASAMRRWPLYAGAGAALAVLIALGAWLTLDRLAPTSEPTVAEDPILAMPKGPGVAVLPFNNLSGDPEQEYFADGITEEIITRLSRFQDLKVIARNSTMQYKGRAVDAREVGRDLGVRFVVEGSVRRAAETVRVTAQLIDAADGSHLWAETYDRPLTVDNIFAIQDELTGAIVGVIADGVGIIMQSLAKESKSKPPGDLAAYDCILLYYQWIQLITAESLAKSIECSERAVEADPDFAAGWAILADAHADDHANGFGLRENALELALDAGRRAVAADPGNQHAHWWLAYAHFYRKERQQFIDEAERALALNPNNPLWIVTVGWGLAWAGEWERGLALIDKGAKLNPRAPDWIYYPVAAYHYRQGAYEEALSVANRIQLHDYFWTPLNKAVNLAQLGRRAEAEAALADAVRLQPNLRESARQHLETYSFEPELVEHYLDGLRKAGLDIPDEPAEETGR